MARDELRARIRDLIWFYDLYGWDWTNAVYFLIYTYRQAN